MTSQFCLNTFSNFTKRYTDESQVGCLGVSQVVQVAHSGCNFNIWLVTKYTYSTVYTWNLWKCRLWYEWLLFTKFRRRPTYYVFVFIRNLYADTMYTIKMHEPRSTFAHMLNLSIPRISGNMCDCLIREWSPLRWLTRRYLLLTLSVTHHPPDKWFKEHSNSHHFYWSLNYDEHSPCNSSLTSRFKDEEVAQDMLRMIRMPPGFFLCVKYSIFRCAP